MKKIGILGGIGWPSTVEYYRIICEASQQHHKGIEYSGPAPIPEIVIESLNQNFTANNRGSSEDNSWEAWDSYFKSAIQRLENSGADVIVMASVTPHARLKEISVNSKVPIISVYDSIGRYCNNQGIRNLLVLGTMPTMSSPAFSCNMECHGITAFYPQEDDIKQEVVNVIGELYQGKTEGTSIAIEDIVRKCIPEDMLSNTAVCLGCTELPLAFTPQKANSSFEHNGIMFLNSSLIHAQSAFKACVS